MSNFADHPNEAFTYFHQKEYDPKSLKKLRGNKEFIAYLVKDGDIIVVYFFFCCIFSDKTIIGGMVDIGSLGKGIPKIMNSFDPHYCSTYRHSSFSNHLAREYLFIKIGRGRE
jgi:hypothetical protein